MLKVANACTDGFATLKASLPKRFRQDKDINLLHILNSNGVAHTIWAFRAVKNITQARPLFIEVAQRAAARANQYAVTATNATSAAYDVAVAAAFATNAAANAANAADVAAYDAAYDTEREKQKEDLLELLQNE